MSATSPDPKKVPAPELPPESDRALEKLVRESLILQSFIGVPAEPAKPEVPRVPTPPPFRKKTETAGNA